MAQHAAAVFGPRLAMAPPVAARRLVLLLVLGIRAGTGELTERREESTICPRYTRTTLWEGTAEYECGGAFRGACNTNTGECTCLPGHFWAAWQVDPGNIEPPAGASCDGPIRAKASESDLHEHKLAFATACSFEFFGCWWIFGPAMLPGVVVPPPRMTSLSERPWLLPKLAMLAGCATLLLTSLSMLLAGQECDCYWLAVRNGPPI